MPISVTMPDAEIAKMAHELAARNGVTEIEAVRIALRRMLQDDQDLAARRRDIESVQREREDAARFAERRTSDDLVATRRRFLDRVSQITQALPILDNRSEEEILGYDEMVR